MIGYIRREFNGPNPYKSTQNYRRTFESHAQLLHMSDNANDDSGSSELIYI